MRVVFASVVGLPTASLPVLLRQSSASEIQCKDRKSTASKLRRRALDEDWIPDSEAVLSESSYRRKRRGILPHKCSEDG
jgi:hypothetical protein